MRLRHIPNPAGPIKDTSCRPHQGAGEHRFSNITAPSAEGQFVDLPAEAGGCTWMLKIHARSAVSSGVAWRRGCTAAASRQTLNIPLTRLFPPCSHLPLCFSSLPSPPSSCYTVFLHARRVNLNPFTQLYSSYIGVLENQTPLWPPSVLHKTKRNAVLSLSISDCNIKWNSCPASLYSTI